jgi:hypothetical protein
MMNNSHRKSSRLPAETRHNDTIMPLLSVCGLENHYMPNSADIVAAARQTLEFA